MLESYGKGKLQDVKTILEQFRGLTVDDVIKTLESLGVSSRRIVRKERKTAKVCPSCGKGVLLKRCGGIYHCNKNCGYSTLKDKK